MSYLYGMKAKEKDILEVIYQVCNRNFQFKHLESG